MTEAEDRLRRALAAEAASVDVRPQALTEIRERIARRRARSWRRFLPTGAALVAVGTTTLATATAGVVAVALALGSGTPRPDPTPTAGPAASATANPTPEPSGEAAMTGTPSPAPPPGRSVNVPVYYLGSSPRGPVLYREFHTVTPPEDSPAARARAAITRMLDPSTPLDPDYASRWPSGVRVRAVSVAGDTVTVDLSGVDPAAGADPVRVRSVDQLVYTATAASGATRTRILLDGRGVPSLWGVSVADPVARRPAVDVLAPVWLINPQHGAVVGRTFTVQVAGIVFEATARVRAVDAGGRTVDDRVVTLDKGPPEQGNVVFPLTLQPGTYTIEAFWISPADGSIQNPDQHTITVR